MFDEGGSLLSVQHKCIQHSIPMVSWQTCTNEEVRSAFLPPAPLSISLSLDIGMLDVPGDIDELGSKVPHSFYTVI
jgi:hypothetical protein